MNEQQVRQLIRDELASLIKSDRYTFEKTLQILDGRNIQLAKGTGTKIGTETTQKLALWGVTPVTQPAHADQGAVSLITPITGSDTVNAADLLTNLQRLQTLVNRLRTDLIAIGNIKGSA